MKNIFCALLILFPTVAPAARNAAAGANKLKLKTLFEAGITDLYNLEYDGAYSKFAALRREMPNHPVGPYSETLALWWQLTNAYDEKNPELETKFIDTAEKALVFMEPLLKTDPDGDAGLCYTGVLGLLARWDTINGHWLSAYRRGKKSFDMEKALLKVHPELYDAYLGIGIFHYYVATLKGIVKGIAKFIFGGSREQGLAEIHLVKDNGRYTRTAALLFLVGIYNNTENNPDMALKLIREGRAEFPDSPFFHHVELLTLEEARQWDDLEKGAKDYISKIDKKAPHYRPEQLHMGYLSLANSALGKRRLEEALGLYNGIIQDFPLEDRWITLTYLNRGKTLDLMGRRQDALQNYRTVLKCRDVWQLHDQANELIRKPYSGKKSKVTKIN